jgi:hypothetical protein
MDGVVWVTVFWVFVARAVSINQVLHDGGVQHGQRHETEADRNPSDGFEVDVPLMQQGKQAILPKWYENDATDLKGDTISKSSRFSGYP